jgi:hypothetical protein
MKLREVFAGRDAPQERGSVTLNNVKHEIGVAIRERDPIKNSVLYPGLPRLATE